MNNKQENATKLAKDLCNFVMQNASSSFMKFTFDEKFEEYLNQGASVEECTSLIFDMLIENNKSNAIKIYASHGANVNIKAKPFDVTPLFYSLLIRRNNPNNLTYLTLLSLGADINAKNTLNSLEPSPMDLLLKIDLTDFEKERIKMCLDRKNIDDLKL